MTVGCKRRCHGIVGARIVGEAVQQDRDRPAVGAVRLAGDVEGGRADGEQFHHLSLVSF